MSNHNKVQKHIKLLEIKLNKFKMYEEEIRTTDPYNRIRIEDCVKSQEMLIEKIKHWQSLLG